jgi:hypothetical protein
MVEKPNFRLPGCVGLLGLPDGFPRQAHFSCKTKPLLTGMSSLEDKMAATTARSIAGSSTLMPPVMLRKRLWHKPETGPFSELLKSYQSLGVVTRRAALRRSVNSCTDQ